MNLTINVTPSGITLSNPLLGTHCTLSYRGILDLLHLLEGSEFDSDAIDGGYQVDITTSMVSAQRGHSYFVTDQRDYLTRSLQTLTLFNEQEF